MRSVRLAGLALLLLTPLAVPAQDVTTVIHTSKLIDGKGGTMNNADIVVVNGKISLGHLAAGYLGLLLLGSAALALGTFGSAIARTQVLAAIFSGCIIVALIVCWLLARVTERPLNDVFVALALHGKHFPPFQSGTVHLRDVVYYLMVTYVALFSATRVMESRRWK